MKLSNYRIIIKTRENQKRSGKKSKNSNKKTPTLKNSVKTHKKPSSLGSFCKGGDEFSMFFNFLFLFTSYSLILFFLLRVVV